MSNTAGGPGQEAKKEEDRSVRRTTSARIQVRAHTVLSWSVDSFAALPEEGCSDDDAEGDDVGGLSSWPPVGSAISLKRQCRIDVPPAVARMQSTEPPDGILQQASNFPVELGCPYLRDPSGASAARRGSAPTPTCLERFAEEAKAARWGRRNTGCDEWDDRADTVGAPLERRRISTERLRKRRSTSVPPNWRSSRLEGVVEVEQEEASDRVQKTHSSLTEPVSAHGAAARDGPERAEPSAAGSQSEEEEEEAAEPAPAGFTPDETVIIFDWDDTLFPTWYLSEVVIPCTDNPDARPEGSSRWDQGLAEESPFAAGLCRHAALVEETLRTARSVARVGIVTLSLRPWVLSSASRYLPDLHLDRLLEELGIPIIYAQELLRTSVKAKAEIMFQDGVNLMTIAKRAAMVKLLRKLYGKSSPWKNVISIGDSVVERDAIIDALWSQSHHESAAAPCCKTVKLVEEPTIDNLSAELVLLGMWLQSMAAFGQDFDVVMDEAEEEELMRLHGRFSA